MPLSHAIQYMQQALALARDAASAGEVPIGAIIVKDGVVIGRGHNKPRELHDPTAHAEITAIRQASAGLENERLTDCDMWVTLEPCAMCAGAISHARIRRLYYAASDPKGGAVEHGPQIFRSTTILHKPDVYNGICAEESAKLLRDFFSLRR